MSILSTLAVLSVFSLQSPATAPPPAADLGVLTPEALKEVYCIRFQTVTHTRLPPRCRTLEAWIALREAQAQSRRLSDLGRRPIYENIHEGIRSGAFQGSSFLRNEAAMQRVTIDNERDRERLRELEAADQVISAAKDKHRARRRR